jgi:hypothetical protein
MRHHLLQARLVVLVTLAPANLMSREGLAAWALRDCPVVNYPLSRRLARALPVDLTVKKFVILKILVSVVSALKRRLKSTDQKRLGPRVLPIVVVWIPVPTQRRLLALLKILLLARRAAPAAGVAILALIYPVDYKYDDLSG